MLDKTVTSRSLKSESTNRFIPSGHVIITQETGNPQLSHPDFWPDKDSILTEDNLISVQERREAELWPCAPNTNTDGESHDL